MIIKLIILTLPSRLAAPPLRIFLIKIPKSAPRADLPPAILIPDVLNLKKRGRKLYHSQQSHAISAHEFAYVISMLHFTNRFHVAARLFSNRSQTTSKCGKNK